MKLAVKRLYSFLPTPLPLSMSQYNAWLKDIVELTGPIADTESLEWVISNEVMRLNPGHDRVPKRTFVKLIRKYAANQFAAAKVMDIKVKQAEAQEAAKLKQVEDTAAAQAASEQKPV